MQNTSQAAPTQQTNVKDTARYHTLKEVMRKQFMALPAYQNATGIQRIRMLARWDAVFDQMVDEQAAKHAKAVQVLQ